MSTYHTKQDDDKDHVIAYIKDEISYGLLLMMQSRREMENEFSAVRSFFFPYSRLLAVQTIQMVH